MQWYGGMACLAPLCLYGVPGTFMWHLYVACLAPLCLYLYVGTFMWHLYAFMCVRFFNQKSDFGGHGWLVRPVEQFIGRIAVARRPRHDHHITYCAGTGLRPRRGHY